MPFFLNGIRITFLGFSSDLVILFYFLYKGISWDHTLKKQAIFLCFDFNSVSATRKMFCRSPRNEEII